jgi:hypothetical protein
MRGRLQRTFRYRPGGLNDLLSAPADLNAFMASLLVIATDLGDFGLINIAFHRLDAAVIMNKLNPIEWHEAASYFQHLFQLPSFDCELRAFSGMVSVCPSASALQSNARLASRRYREVRRERQRAGRQHRVQSRPR